MLADNETLDTARAMEQHNQSLSIASHKVASKAKTAGHSRFKSSSTLATTSRYAHIPTENLKFDSFLEALFSSKLMTSHE